MTLRIECDYANVMTQCQEVNLFKKIYCQIHNHSGVEAVSNRAGKTSKSLLHLKVTGVLNTLQQAISVLC